jgi:hypothetical protein
MMKYILTLFGIVIGFIALTFFVEFALRGAGIIP